MEKEFKLLPHRLEQTLQQQDVNEIPKGVKMIHAPEVWEKAKSGKGVVVAVLDTGCDTTHPELIKRVIGGRNFTSDYNEDPERYDDNHYHGTHVAGTVSASVNLTGVAGVAPEASILVLKVLNGEGSGSYQGIIKAIDYAIGWRGPNGEKVGIMNMSFGGPRDYAPLHDAIKRAITANILVVCAAGNEGDGSGHSDEFAYPGAYPEVVEVGAVDLNGALAWFSNTNSEIDLVAPGVDILSTFPRNQYAVLSGTSMATPHVAGAAALLINIFRSAFDYEPTEAELYAFLVQNTRPLGLGKKAEGHGLLDLTYGPKEPDKPDEGDDPVEQPIERTYSIIVKPLGDGYIVQLGFYHEKENAIRLANQLQKDLQTVDGVAANDPKIYKLAKDED